MAVSLIAMAVEYQEMKTKGSEFDLLTYELNMLEDPPTSDEVYNGTTNVQNELIETNQLEQQPKRSLKEKKYHWMFLALLAHTGWGLYPVLARYLQTVCGLPSMSLLMTGNGTIAIISFAILVYRGKFFVTIRLKLLPLMILVTVIRVVTNLLSPKFTMAIYVQAVTLLTPFLVAGLNSVVLKERMPQFTLPALVCCTLGAFLMLVSSAIPWEMSISLRDVEGIGLAFISASFLAVYMIMVRKIVSETSIKGDELLFFLTGPVVVISALLSFILEEDWSPWMDLKREGWIMWIIFAFGVLLFCNLLQISSIQVLGAPMVSTLLAFRLISSLVFSVLIMDEALSDPLQFLGAFVVLVSITSYMWLQQKKKS